MLWIAIVLIALVAVLAAFHFATRERPKSEAERKAIEAEVKDDSQAW